MMPTVTDRKAISFGTNGLVMTIPKAWIDYYGVRAGDMLRVVADDVLTIHPPRWIRTRGDGSGPEERE